jgi:hypothetical protein
MSIFAGREMEVVFLAAALQAANDGKVGSEGCRESIKFKWGVGDGNQERKRIKEGEADGPPATVFPAKKTETRNS